MIQISIARAMRHCCAGLGMLLIQPALAEQVTIAVASNFITPVTELVSEFEQATDHEIRVSTASTGILYAAIRNGARYAAFLAADSDRPQRLEQDGFGVPDTRFTYAIGTLELWSIDPELHDKDCRSVLDDLGKRRLAIANPVTAPYGAAAKAFLERAGLWERVQPSLVYGQNIVQTLQFVGTRNASLGLVATSQAQSERLPEPTCRWPVPASMHPPIEQQAILLGSSEQHEIAASFLDFMASPEGKAIITAHGYQVAD